MSAMNKIDTNREEKLRKEKESERIADAYSKYVAEPLSYQTADAIFTAISANRFADNVWEVFDSAGNF